MVLTVGCGTTGIVKPGGPATGLPPDLDEEVLQESAEAEATYAVARLWTVASGVRLEHAHLFPDEDINAASSLLMVPREAHEAINALWTRFRQVRPDATAREVEAMARIIDERFKPWLNQPNMPAHTPYSLDKAAETALEQLQRLFAGLN